MMQGSFLRDMGLLLETVVLCLRFGDGQSVQEPGLWQRYRTVCYTLDKARERAHPAKFMPENIDPSLCTHLVFAFASLHKSGLFIVPTHPHSHPHTYRSLTALKLGSPGLKVMLSVGGWDMASEQFTKLVSSAFKMRLFARGTIAFLRHYELDGADIDWEYPGQRGSPPRDKRRFTRLLQILHMEFLRDHRETNRTRLLLSAAISPAPYIVSRSYQLPLIASHVDFLNVMTYDLHMPSEHRVAHHSSLFSTTKDETGSVDNLIQRMLNASVPSEKINLGLPFYGYCHDLSDPNNTTIGAATKGPCVGGSVTGQQGTVLYSQMCQQLTNLKDPNRIMPISGHLLRSQAPYLIDGSRWTGYDDENSIRVKVDYVMQRGLGGVFIWTIDMDDYHGHCGGGRYPLLRTIQHTFHGEDRKTRNLRK